MTATTSMKKFITGIALGVASMLPGISGAIIAVCMGVYERIVEDLADIFHKIKTDFAFLVLLGGGIMVGMAATAFGLEFIMSNCLAISYLFFLGLIIGQLPELYGMTEPKSGKPTVWNIVAFAFCFIMMLSFAFLGVGKDVKLGLDVVSLLIVLGVGALFSVSKLAPGVSGSALLLALGLYKPLLDAVTSFNITYLALLFVGFAVALLLFAKFMDKCLKEHRRSTYSGIFGFTVASVFLVMNYTYPAVHSWVDIVGGAIALVIGIGISLLFIRLGDKSFE